MSDRKIYTSYIKYVKKNYSSVDWDVILDKYLKISPRHKPDVEDLKEASLKIYYSILLGSQIGDGHFGPINHDVMRKMQYETELKSDYDSFLQSKKDSDALKKLFVKNSKTMGDGMAVYYLDVKDVIKHIAEIGEGVTKKKQKLSLGTLKRSPVKKEKKSIKTVKVSPKKECTSYTVVQLKEIAKERGITGISSLRKAELCKTLGISDGDSSITNAKAISPPKKVIPSKRLIFKDKEGNMIKPSAPKRKSPVKKETKIIKVKPGQTVTTTAVAHKDVTKDVTKVTWVNALEGVIWPAKFKKPMFIKIGKKDVTDILQIRDYMLKKAKCGDYQVSQLRELAKKENMQGRSKMGKEELCEALGIPLK